jgi:hypothetical protein
MRLSVLPPLLRLTSQIARRSLSALFVRCCSGIQYTILAVLRCLVAQWPRGLRHELASLTRTLWLWVQIQFKAMMFICVYSVLFCVGSVLATAWSPVQAVQPTVLGLRNWSETKRFTDALCFKVRETGMKERERGGGGSNRLNLVRRNWKL